MKKVLVFLLTLGFVANMFAIDFGNGLTAAGEVKAGIRVDSADDGSEDTSYDTKVYTYNNDADKSFRTRLTLGYTGDWGGAKIRFESLGAPAEAKATFATKYAYGWANLLDSKIVLSGGAIGDDLWGLGKLSTNVFDPSIDAITGVRAEFKLVEGLSFGAGLAVPVSDTKTYTDVTNATIDHVAGGWVIGGLYKSDFFSAALGAAFKPGTDETAAGKDSYGWVLNDKNDPSKGSAWGLIPGSAAVPAADPYVDAIAGIQVNPISGFTALVDVRLDTRKWETHGKIGYVRIGPKFVYATGPITAHLQGDIKIQNEAPGEDGTVTDRDGKGKYKVKPGNYAEITKVSVTWGDGSSEDYQYAKYTGDPTVGVRIGADYKVNDTIGAYLQIGSDNVLWFAGHDDLTKIAEDGNPFGAGFYIKPGIKFTLGTSSIEIFDKINRLGASTIKLVEDWSPVTNQFQIDFNWVF
ncbi:MAG: hypothetical protein LBG27_12440 [Spirochaetaceae bacterium]|jgi:hypothetical protein|nr:hypothetical protein [Spirochaetaceae bacterium]